MGHKQRFDVQTPFHETTARLFLDIAQDVIDSTSVSPSFQRSSISNASATPISTPESPSQSFPGWEKAAAYPDSLGGSARISDTPTTSSVCRRPVSPTFPTYSKSPNFSTGALSGAVRGIRTSWGRIGTLSADAPGSLVGAHTGGGGGVERTEAIFSFRSPSIRPKAPGPTSPAPLPGRPAPLRRYFKIYRSRDPVI